MIAVLKETATEQQIVNLVNWFESQGLKVNRSQGDFVTILGLIGDTTKIDIDLLRGLDIIDTRKLQAKKRKEKPLLPVVPAVPDRIKQLEYEADQKALAECLNYSIDVAYRTGDR